MQLSEHEVTVENTGAERPPQRRRGKGSMVLLGLLVMGGLLALNVINLVLIENCPEPVTLTHF